MKSTYYTQCQNVNQGKSFKCLREEWPFWFDELGMSVHFKELTGIDLKETFTRNLDLKGKRLLDYLTTVAVSKSKAFLQTYARLQRMWGLQSGCSDDMKEMVLLLLSYFEEKEESMLFCVEDTCLADEVQLEQVPLTPTIIVCGQSCSSSRRYMLSIDRNLVSTNIASFISALCLMFGSYYNFNIHYPSELASTLEFLQRKRNQSREQKLKASSQCEPSSPHPDSGSRRPRVALSLNLDSLWTVSFTLLILFHNVY